MPSDEQKNPTPDDASRRSFLKTSAKGALLLPYITPAIESIFLSEVHAQDDDDDDDSGSSTSRAKGKPSLLGNEPPPPPGNSNDNSDEDSGDDDDDDGRGYGEPPKDK